MTSTSVSSSATENGAFNVGNAAKKFRDGFASLAQNESPTRSIWKETWTNQGNSTAGRRGNSSGSAYLNVSMDPLTAGSEYILETERLFLYPMRVAFGLSVSQRVFGQEIEISVVSATRDVTETLPTKADLAISGSISVTSNVATINFATNHGLTGGDRVILKNNTDSRMNVGPVVVTVISNTQITIPLTIANATYTAGGSVQWADHFRYANNAVGLLLENATVTNGSWVSRRNGFNTRYTTAQTIQTTAGIQSNTSAYTDSFNPTGRYELVLNQEESALITRANDGTSALGAPLKYTNGLADEEKDYKVRLRVKNLENITRPVARIVSATKSGTTTATIVTDVAHGLNTLDQVQIYGVRDQTNYPNLTVATAIASIVNATTFTIIIGPAVTNVSNGGSVYRVNGGVLAPGVFAQVAQSISRTSNVLTIVGNATWATPLPGENIYLHGCNATSMGLYDGSYKVLRVNTTSLQLESTGPDFVSINCGGTVIRKTDVRLHFVSQLEYTRHIVELAQNNGINDVSRSLPVNAVVNSGVITTVTGVTTVSTVTTVTGVTTVSTVTAAGLQIPITVADIASAALATTTTTAAVTPAQGVSYRISIPVTVVTGTNPTLDVSIEESDDSGTNWFKVYDFPRITTTGIYRSPVIQLTGNRVRYVQTVGGATPSFTRSLNRLQAHASSAFNRQLIDRTIVPNTITSTSATLAVYGLSDFNLFVRCTAQTTPATIALQFSHDATNWYTSATTVATINGLAQAKVTNERWGFVRAIVTVGGTGITLAELVIAGSNS
jgi:hypothetical protein